MLVEQLCLNTLLAAKTVVIQMKVGIHGIKSICIKLIQTIRLGHNQLIFGSCQFCLKKGKVLLQQQQQPLL